MKSLPINASSLPAEGVSSLAAGQHHAMPEKAVKRKLKKPKTTRFTMHIPESILEEVDRMAEETGARNRAELIQNALRFAAGVLEESKDGFTPVLMKDGKCYRSGVFKAFLM